MSDVMYTTSSSHLPNAILFYLSVGYFCKDIHERRVRQTRGDVYLALLQASRCSSSFKSSNSRPEYDKPVVSSVESKTPILRHIASAVP